jgi:hypothetical protein
LTIAERSFFVYAVMYLFGLWLFRNPRYKHGCKTVAEDIWTYGMDEFITTLIE